MKNLAFICMLILALGSPAMAIDIAISTQAGWWAQGTADTEMQDIVDSVTAANPEIGITLFTSSDHDALADWVVAHTGDGAEDLLILCGIFPDTLYPGGNAQPDDSLAELFLDDGNTIINTGDYIFYVGSVSNNDAGGLENMMDIPGIGMWGDDALPCVPTAEGQELTPSLVDIPSTRPFFFDQLTNDWHPELVLAQSADGSRGDPVIVRNSVTGGRVGIFFQVADALTDIRGEVISEWINNWYILNVSSQDVAREPVPAGSSKDVYRYTDLSWTPGNSAVTHDVYFGTVQADVNSATRDNPMGLLLSQGQAEATFDLPGALDFGVTYFWRIDEIGADSSLVKGNVWSFTAEDFIYPVQNVTATSNTVSDPGKGPENLVNGSGLNAADQHSIDTFTMWGGKLNPDEPSYIDFEFDGIVKLYEMLIWNYNMEYEVVLGLGVKNATIEYSLDGTEWAVLGDFDVAQAPGNAAYTANTTIPLEGVAAKYIRLTVNSGFAANPILHGLSEVRFMHIPTQASGPNPADGATGVDVQVPLTWRPGREAVSHEIYLGTDPNALALAGAVGDNRYTPAALDLATTYSWQVIEVNDAEAVATWAGRVWSFMTQDSIEVEGFERYNDDFDAGTAIWQTWIDAFEDASNGGSMVGNDPSPFAELTIVHGGSQSMPLYFDNGSASDISETDRNFASGQNWAASGIKSLSFWFHGTVGNTGQLYAKINGTQVLYDGPAVNIARPAWQLWSIDLSTVGNVSNVSQISIGIEGVGTGVIYVDDIGLYPEVIEYLSPDITGPGDAVVGVPNDADWPAAETPDLAIDDDTATKFLHFKGATGTTGIKVTPLAGSTVVTEMTLTTANDHADRDPVAFEFYGSNAGIDGPYTLIASGDIVDFVGATEWPRFTKNATPITFDNNVAYKHYQILFTAVRDPDVADSMQIAEIELIGTAQ